MMKRRVYIGAVLCAAVWGSAGTLMAQGLDQLLDKQLGAKAAENAAPQADQPKAKPDAAGQATPAGSDKPDAAKDKPPANPGGPDIISPDAVRKVDDADLLKQLTQQPDDKKAAADKAAENFADMMDRMGQSAHRLTDKDTGEVTQETQRRIVSDLDVLIEYARQQQQQSKPGPPGPPQQGDAQAPQPSSGNQQGNSQGGGNVAAASSQLPGGGIADGSPGDMRSSGASNWGDLPPRDRAQVSHGANEEALPSYRELIDRYYQALAEMGKTRNR